MMKRVVWFSAGAVTGFGGAVYGYVRLRRSAGRPAAERVATVVADTARTGVDGARRFVDDARVQIRQAESEMRQLADPEPPEPGVSGRFTDARVAPRRSRRRARSQ
jgi:hypothetical protein